MIKVVYAGKEYDADLQREETDAEGVVRVMVMFPEGERPVRLGALEIVGKAAEVHTSTKATSKNPAVKKSSGKAKQS